MIQRNQHHDKKTDQAYRDEIKNKIYIILKHKMKQMHHNIEVKQLTQLSAAFEARLYKCAPTLEFHRDYSTLDSRVKVLAIQLGQKLERRKRSQTITRLSIEDRATIFNSVERRSKLSFEDIRETVETVQRLRKNGYTDMRIRENGEACRVLSCLVPTYTKSQTKCNTKHISIAMKNIYFRTRLVEAFNRLYSMQTNDTIQRFAKGVDWDLLIEEARDSIYHFERWERVQVRRLK